MNRFDDDKTRGLTCTPCTVDRIVNKYRKKKKKREDKEKESCTEIFVSVQAGSRMKSGISIRHCITSF